MIDAIRNEHARVYLQDQALLRTIKENKVDQNMGGVGIQHLASSSHDANNLVASFDNRSVVSTGTDLEKERVVGGLEDGTV